MVIARQAGNCLGLVVNGHRISVTGGYNVTSTSPGGTVSIVSD